ncbi:MAG: gliding motility protein GldM, partial [Patescibacteria group bacterium]|nr:gliding motility protein GldM [Patescibacteria group bacterium]
KSVQERSNELFEYMRALKVEIVSKTEGEDSEAIEDGKVITEKIRKIDDLNVPSEVMIGANNNGKAFDLKAALTDYRQFLLEQIGDKHPNVTHSIENSLDTDDVKELDGTTSMWESHNFQVLPLVAVITILSKLQNDVRNAEADALDFFYSQIGAADIRVNKLVPQVMGVNYVMQGSDYEAKVFIAAMDSTARPVIQVGPYRSSKNADGTTSYEMTGSAQTLSINDNGMGIYKTKPTVLGDKSWGGLIKVKAPDGSEVVYPFKQSYTVVAPNVVVSPTAMNVFYTGVDNPVDISVPGVDQSKISVSMSNGRIRKGKHPRFRGSYIVRPTRVGTKANITVSAEVSGQRRTFAPVTFRVKPVPPPVAKIAGKKGGPIKLNVLKAQRGVAAELENFDFDIKWTVTSFRVSINDKGYTIDQDSNNNTFTSQQKQLFNRLRKNDQIVFQDIKAKGPDGKIVRLDGAIVFKIQ